MGIPAGPQVSIIEQGQQQFLQTATFQLPPVGTLLMPRSGPGKNLNNENEISINNAFQKNLF